MGSESDNDEDLKKCGHKHFKLTNKTTTVKSDIIGFKQLIMKLNFICTDCDRKFLFKGPLGFSTEVCSVSEDFTELIIPFDYPLNPIRDPEEENDEDETVH